MPFLGRALLAIGGLFLSHACYSAHEYTQLLSSGAMTSGPSPNSSVVQPAIRSPAHATSASILVKPNLPTDIVVEILVALFLLTLGIVLSSEPLKPIRWNEWAALVEHGKHGGESRYLKQQSIATGEPTENTTEELGQQLYGGPSQEGYGYLEYGRRMGFFDIRTKRKEFAEWVKKGGEKDTKL